MTVELQSVGSDSCENPSMSRYSNKGCRCEGCCALTRRYNYNYRKKNRETISQQRKYKRSKTDDIDARREYQLRRKFNLTSVEYDAILERQGGGCAICRQARDPNGRWLAVDHCHDTGRVRGLLCTNCNQAIGKLQDNPDRLRVAVAYLERQ